MNTGASQSDVLHDRLAAINKIEEAVKGELNVGQTPQRLARLLVGNLEAAIKSLDGAVDSRSTIGAQLSRDTAASTLNVTTGDIKNAVTSVARALQKCRPDNLNIPQDEDRIGVAAVDAVIGGVPHLVIVRGPTSEHRGNARNPDALLRLAVEFRPVERQSGSGLLTDARRRLFAPRLVIEIAFLVSVVVAAIVLHRQATGPLPSPSLPVPVRQAMVVLTFRNNSGNLNDKWLATALPEIVSRALGEGRNLRIVPRDEAFRLERDLGLLRSDGISPDELQALRARTGANSVVTGSYTIERDIVPARIDIQVQLLDAGTGRVLLAKPVTGTESKLAETALRIATIAIEPLQLSELTSDEKNDVVASVPSQLEALRLYAEGIAELRQFHAKAARQLLTQAAGMDSENPAILFALFEACDALGLEAEARDAIRRAQDAVTQIQPYSDYLSWDTKQKINAQFYACEARFGPTEERSKRSWQEAVNATRWLWRRNRDATEYAVALVKMQISASKIDEALTTIATLRRPPSAQRVISDPRIDLEEARAYQEQGRLDRQLAPATTAAAKGVAVHDCELVGEAQMLRATALLGSSKASAASEAIKAARSCFQAIGDFSWDARAIEQTATAAGLAGNLILEQDLLGQALTVHRDIGDRRSMARIMVRMANKLVREGSVSEARRNFSEALITFKTMGNPYYVGATLNEEGALMFDAGELHAAEERYTKEFEFFQTISNTPGMAAALTNIGETLACRGELGRAYNKHLESLAYNRKPLGGGEPDNSGVAFDLARIADIFALQGKRDLARNNYEEALSIQAQVTKERGEAAKTNFALARLLIEDGNPAEGEKRAREAEQVLAKGGEIDYSIEAASVRAAGLIAQGKNKEAHEVAARAWQAVAESENRRLRFEAAIPYAQALVALDDRNLAQALTLLEIQRAEAARTQYVVAALRIGLASGELEYRARMPSARARLTAVAGAAKAKGIWDIARRAAIIQSPSTNKNAVQ